MRLSDISHLYHSTDFVGFVHSVKNNSINAFTQNYISMTTNPKQFSIMGRDHNYFRFTFEASDLITRYDAKFHTHTVVQTDGKVIPLDENEVALKTKIITPLDGLLKNFGIFWPLILDEFAISFLCRDTKYGKPIDSIVSLLQKNIPFYLKTKLATKDDIEHINFIHDICNSGYNSNTDDEKNKILKKIINKYGEMRGVHGSGVLTSNEISMRSAMPEIQKSYHDILTKKEIVEINSDDIRQTTKKALEKIGLGHNSVSMYMDEFEKRKFFTPTLGPQFWASVFSDIIDYSDDLNRQMWKFNFLADYYGGKIKRYQEYLDGKRSESEFRWYHLKTTFPHVDMMFKD
ncbi:MAG: hypothetical protein WC284_12560 [Candidimonas sp.]